MPWSCAGLNGPPLEPKDLEQMNNTSSTAGRVTGGLAAAVILVTLTTASVHAQRTTAPRPLPLRDAPRFEVDPFWPKPLPNNWILGQVSGVAVDTRGHVWIVQRPRSLSERELGAAQSPPMSRCCVAAPPVLVFDQAGNIVRAWGGTGTGYEWPESEHGVFVDGEDRVWVAGNGDKDSQILKFTLDGKFLLQIGRSGQSKGSNDTANLGSPADISVDLAAREVYVADGYRNRRVIVFDSETGAYKRHWGAYGKPPSDAATPPYDPAAPPAAQFGRPVHCVRPARDGLVYVCDRTNNRLQVFRKDGTFVSEAFFEKATRLNGSVSEVAFSQDAGQRYVYMVDGVNNELRVVERRSLSTLARIGRPGRYAGQFHVVHNVAVDQQGHVYTTEVNTGQRVQRFRRVSR
jgi:DNA-binding beta-propeller fold protein YncE